MDLREISDAVYQGEDIGGALTEFETREIWSAV